MIPALAVKRGFFIHGIIIMSALDAYHDVVVDALDDDGWTVADGPLFLRVGSVRVYIDIAAEKLIAAERGTEKIAVEVKAFIQDSNVSEFHCL